MAINNPRFVKKLSVCLIIPLFFIALFARAEMVDTYRFKNAEDRLRAVELAKSLRCPQCQNQNLVESNSPIAYDLRLEVYKMVDEGKSNRQIIDLMTSRFGDFVLYKPPFQWTTAVLWIGPLLLILCAAGLSWRYLRRHAENGKTAAELNPAQKAALNNLLNRQDKK